MARSSNNMPSINHCFQLPLKNNGPGNALAPNWIWVNLLVIREKWDLLQFVLCMVYFGANISLPLDSKNPTPHMVFINAKYKKDTNKVLQGFMLSFTQPASWPVMSASRHVQLCVCVSFSKDG